jgi:GT2 family glycosyltransferase
VGEDGRYQQSCHYFTILKARYALLLFLTLIGSRGFKGLGLSTNPSGDGRGQAVVDWIYTACALVRREVFERVGLLDENLFFGGDDMELCYRAGQAGWKTVYLPQAEIIHYGNQSAVQVFGEAHSYARARARVIGIDYFLRKNFSALHSYVIRGILGVGSLVIAMLLRVASLLKQGDREIAVRAAHSERMGLACLASMFWRGGKEYSWVRRD